MSQEKVSTTGMPVIVGLTGGIASGKSTVSAYFAKLGVTIIDADLIAREVVEPGTEGFEAIKETFGAQVLAEDGSLDRKALGAVIFNDAEKRSQLNAIVHPAVATRMLELAQAAGNKGSRWVIYDAALLVENGAQHWLPEIIVVSASTASQLQRIMQRDELSADEASARINSQLPLQDKVKVATHVIDNDGTLEHTWDQTKRIFEELTDRYGTP